MDHTPFIAPPGKKIRLANYDPAFTGEFSGKKDAKKKLEKGIQQLAKYQDILYADNRYALLIIFQAMDAAGKDSAIEHVMSGVNPQGCQVFSFKTPSAEELDHDFLWRCIKALPERGRIGIFNRSYYEEVLVVRVHPEFLQAQKLPQTTPDKGLWRDRYEDINNFEHYLTRNGIVVLKFFLHVSKDEQRQRFLERIEQPEKNCKFSLGDVQERAHWDEYMQAYEDTFIHTSTSWAPWHIIPADHKWVTHALVADIIVDRLAALNLEYPKVSKEHRQELLKAKEALESSE